MDKYIITRKIKLFPIGDKEEIDRVYKYLRDGIEAQNKAMNEYMSALYVTTMMEICKEDRKLLQTLFQRVSDSKLGSGYDKNIHLPKGLPMGGTIQRKVSNDFFMDMKKGLLYGNISLRNYKKDNPLLVHVDYIRPQKFSEKKTGLYHNYKTDDEFVKHCYDSDFEVLIGFANHIIFKCIFGNPHKSLELRNIFINIFNGLYEVGGSSIEIKGTKIFLNLTLKIPKKKIYLDENIVVGVDLGQAKPAVCAVNNNKYKRLYIGSKEDLLRQRTKIQNQYKRVQKSLKNTNGGHGRKKKLKPLDRFNKYEENFVKSYNHIVSKKVVDFALKNNAKYINLEYLKGYDKSKFILRNWSYYQLQTYIEQKAAKYDIIVRYINPCFTSQVCNECKHWEENQRKSQSEFVCGDGCFVNLKNKNINADFNAARNISKSTLFLDKTKNYAIEELIEQAKKYYGIK